MRSGSLGMRSIMLHFGFGLYDETKDGREYWQLKFESLTKPQKEFYHQWLGLSMICWGVSHISEESIEEIVLRECHTKFGILNIPEELKTQDEKDNYVREMLKVYIGFQTNVIFETRSHWINRQTGNLIPKSKFKSEKVIEEEHDRFEQWQKTQVTNWVKEKP